MKNILFSFLTILNEMSPYILLGFLIAGLLHVFVRPEVMARHLSGRGWKPVMKAALFGIPLPLCSCGVLPAAVSLRRQGASKGAATSFLIATPQTGVDSIAATYSLLGLPFAILRPVAALIGAFFGGIGVNKWDKADDGDTSADSAETVSLDPAAIPSSFWGKLREAVRYGLVDMVASVGKWLVIGLVIATLITIFVPDSLFLSLSAHPLLAMLVMVIIAIPMYICATGSIPIALSLMLKGLSPGIAFVLLMAGPAVNFASVMILARSNGRRATAIYLTSVAVTAIGFGLMIDYLLPTSWFAVGGALSGPSCHEAAAAAPAFGWFESACSALLATLLVIGAFKHRKSHSSNSNDMTKTYKISGMECAHCRRTVEQTLTALPGATAVSVDLPTSTATVSGDVSPEAVTAAIHKAGFTVV